MAERCEAVTIEDRRWIDWSKAWPEDLRAHAREMVDRYRRFDFGDSDRERAYAAFLAIRGYAPANLGGPQARQD